MIWNPFSAKEPSTKIEGNDKIEDQEFLVIDGEMTGYEVKEHSLISFALIPIIQKRLEFSQSKEWAICPSEWSVDPNSALVHKMGAEKIAEGMDEKLAAQKIIQEIEGKILIGHNIQLDIKFLKKLFSKHDIEFAPKATLDTASLMQWHHRRNNPHQEQTAHYLKMDNLIKEMDLPRYPQHSAFNDCIITGALFLKLLHEIQEAGYSKLKDLIKLGK